MSLTNTAGFVARNPRFSAQNVRKLPEYHRAMAAYLRYNPVCEFCGIKSGRVEVHHIIPVRERPDLAAHLGNMMTLHARNRCHLTVGHFGSWQRINPDAWQFCMTREQVATRGTTT